MNSKTNKVRVGLITTSFAINFGAVLQAYSLRKKIENIGYECEIINYIAENKVSSRKIIYSFKSIKSAIYSVLELINIKYRVNYRKKVILFDKFLKKHCNLSKEKYFTYSEMFNELPYYDCLVCGSDQIWNLNIFDNPIFFLRFEKKYPHTNYVAYAPSIAENLTTQQYEIFKSNVAHFSSLSIREINGAQKISTLINKPIQSVLDPIFLIEKKDWAKMAEPLPINGKYLLCYSIGAGKYFREYVLALKKKLGYKLVYINLSPFDKLNSDINLNNISPENFIWLFLNASFIITSSFHGTAFSVHFRKQFYSVPGLFRSSRHYSLLAQFNLTERILDSRTKLNLNKDLSFIDYQKVEVKITDLIRQSSMFLITSLDPRKQNI